MVVQQSAWHCRPLCWLAGVREMLKPRANKHKEDTAEKKRTGASGTVMVNNTNKHRVRWSLDVFFIFHFPRH